MDVIWNIVTSFAMGFVNLLLLPWHIYNWAVLDTLKEKMNVIVLMGMSHQFFFVVVALVLLIIGFGIYKRTVLRTAVHLIEQFNGRIGRFAAWFVLLMMIQQVSIIAMGQIFRGNELAFSPLGMTLFSEELQWLSGQLKFYNAILIAMASAFTFIEGGHVRVDLIYSVISKRAQHWVDFYGTLFLFLPSTIMLWWFSWPIAMNSVFRQRPMNIFSEKASWRSFKFESSGTAEFSWVWAFKMLVVVFAGLMFICAVGFLLRKILALLERDEDIATHYSFDGSSYNGMGMSRQLGPKI